MEAAGARLSNHGWDAGVSDKISHLTLEETLQRCEHPGRKAWSVGLMTTFAAEIQKSITGGTFYDGRVCGISVPR